MHRIRRETDRHRHTDGQIDWQTDKEKENRDSQSGTQTRRQTCRNNTHHSCPFCPRQLYICRFSFVNGIVKQSIPPPTSPNPRPREIVRTKRKFETKTQKQLFREKTQSVLEKITHVPRRIRKPAIKTLNSQGTTTLLELFCFRPLLPRKNKGDGRLSLLNRPAKRVYSFCWFVRRFLYSSFSPLSLSLSLHRRAVKLIFLDTTLTTDQKLKEMRIMRLQKQLEYNKGLFMYWVLSNEAPVYISNMCTHTPSCYSSSRNYHLSLPRPRIDIFKTNISFYGSYLWNNLPLTVRSCQSLSSFKSKLRANLEVVT